MWKIEIIQNGVLSVDKETFIFIAATHYLFIMELVPLGTQHEYYITFTQNNNKNKFKKH